MEPTLTVLSFGAGRDSTALLYMIAEDPVMKAMYASGDFIVIQSDTKDEHEESYENTEHVQQYCKAKGIPFFFLTSDKGYHHGKWQGLREFYRATTTCGSKVFRKTCTDNLKIKPIYRFLEDYIAEKYDLKKGKKKAFREFAKKYGKIRMIIGIAKGEESRIGTDETKFAVWQRLSIERSFPLVELGMDRAACQEKIRSFNQPIPPPSNCKLCPFMSLIELLWLFRFHPADYWDWVDIERNKLERFKHLGDRNAGVWPRKTLEQKLAEAHIKHGHMSNEELSEYKMSHGHCVKSKY